MTDDLIKRLGKIGREHASSESTSSNVYELPPLGTARLAGREGDSFVWEPIPRERWDSMEDSERGTILASRAFQWLDVNADVKTAPVAFQSVNTAEQLFGITPQTLREAICETHKLLHENPIRGKAALLSISVIILVITGLHPAAFTPEVAELVLEIVVEQLCVDETDEADS